MSIMASSANVRYTSLASQLIRDLIEANEHTAPADIAEHFNVSLATLADWAAGTSAPTLDQLECVNRNWLSARELVALGVAAIHFHDDVQAAAALGLRRLSAVDSTRSGAARDWLRAVTFGEDEAENAPEWPSEGPTAA